MRAAHIGATVLVLAALSLGLKAQGGLGDVAKADINDDLVVDSVDLAIVRAAYGKRAGQNGFNALADIDGNGVVNVADLTFVQRHLGRTVPAPPAVHINEVESNGGVPGDWIEFINVGTTVADLSGWSIRDNDDTHVYVIPAGTTIAPGGYYVAEEIALEFGLGAADAVRLFDASGYPFEAYSWTSHAPITYGRCPNGTGTFGNTFAVTKGAANSCTAPVTTVHINEIESNPADWIEFVNTGAAAADISGWSIRDNDDTHVYTLPAGTIIAPGGYLVVDDPPLGFGLGTTDAVRFFNASGVLFESFDWVGGHAATTYGRCPNGSGSFIVTASATKGAASDCGGQTPLEVKINEIESSDSTPGPDWIELFNPAGVAADLSGVVLKDNDDTHIYTFPAGSSLPSGGYLVVEETALGFGLGSADSARLFTAAGALLDSHTWSSHATTTYGRCPNGAGAFATTSAATKGALNSCPGDPVTWPGSADVATADGANVLGGNMSGLVYERPAGLNPVTVLWAVKNGPGTLFRLVFDAVANLWSPDADNDWSAGKALKYPDGTGNPDAEGVTFTGAGAAAGIYVATERNNDANGISRNSILRFDQAAAGGTLIATNEWNVTALLPVVGANLGLEAITWVPDAYLTASGFLDDAAGGAVYSPASYPNHGDGLFFVGVEGNGQIYAFALNHATNSATLITTVSSTMVGVMDLLFDRELNQFWAVCDDTCQGRSTVFTIVAGRLTPKQSLARPANMPNLNNEGFTFAPLAECAGNMRPVFWADDANTAGHAIRTGAVTCAAF